MEFWGAEVKAEKPLKVTPDEGCLLHLSQASLDKGKKGETVFLYLTVGWKKICIGTLVQDNIPQISFDLAFEKEFELSHSSKGNVHFIGYKSPNVDEEVDCPDSEEEEEEELAVPAASVPLLGKRVSLLGKSVLQQCTTLKSQKTDKRKKKKKEGSLLGKSVLQQCTTLKKQKTDKRKKRKKEDSCCFGCEEALGNNEETILVKGFQHLRPRDEIKNELSNIFGSCGKVLRVFVPMQCVTCVPLGHAFIDLLNGQKKALKLNGSYMGGRKLKVKRAADCAEYYGYEDFDGCDCCRGQDWCSSSRLVTDDYERDLSFEDPNIVG